MKSLLATAGALALMMSAAACGAADTDTTEINTPEVMADTTVDGDTTMTTDRQVASYTLASGEHEASDLIGASVHNPAGEEIATVADIWLGANGSAPMIVVRDGGVAGVGGKLRTVAYSAATIAADPETSGDEPNVLVRLTDETLETLPEFEQVDGNDFRLASEMIGTTVDVSFNGESARINDLILTNTGEARYAVISPDLVSTNQIVVDANAITVAQGDTDGGLVLDLDAQTFAAAPDYPRE
ncbi:PRC-barrel domain-containing protein [Hyphomonas sp.]|uniref:PRC-barrel domain-containing protein n=1 Tax=Hyphomonas sp. TaxID=87 RepID=UPI000A6704D3|nr:PRC-barrel domain-containing protein [Hyphomonas sp.]